ncbi:MAG TPA: hypothetical protein VLU41_02680 [Ideonella sp.]|nr:hypothetical protein [Ideonella sp.]
MMVRIDIGIEDGLLAYRVSEDGEDLYDDAGLGSVAECLVGAIEALPPRVVAVEVAYDGIVSGTYPLQVVAMNLEQVARHAVNTTEAIDEAWPERHDRD